MRGSTYFHQHCLRVRMQSAGQERKFWVWKPGIHRCFWSRAATGTGRILSTFDSVWHNSQSWCSSTISSPHVIPAGGINHSARTWLLNGASLGWHLGCLLGREIPSEGVGVGARWCSGYWGGALGRRRFQMGIAVERTDGVLGQGTRPATPSVWRKPSDRWMSQGHALCVVYLSCH